LYLSDIFAEARSYYLVKILFSFTNMSLTVQICSLRVK
jgi:hypothetical protein